MPCGKWHTLKILEKCGKFNHIATWNWITTSCDTLSSRVNYIAHILIKHVQRNIYKYFCRRKTHKNSYSVWCESFAWDIKTMPESVGKIPTFPTHWFANKPTYKRMLCSICAQCKNIVILKIPSLSYLSQKLNKEHEGQGNCKQAWHDKFYNF